MLLRRFLCVSAPRAAGRVVSVSDAVLTIDGLRSVRSGSVLSIGEARAVATTLERQRVSALRTDTQPTRVTVGDEVTVAEPNRAADAAAALPRWFGSVRAFDGRDLLSANTQDDAPPPPSALSTRAALRAFECAPPHAPLFTGAAIVDALFPVARGQRIAVVGPL